jgi:hypothetical protein
MAVMKIERNYQGEAETIYINKKLVRFFRITEECIQISWNKRGRSDVIKRTEICNWNSVVREAATLDDL